MTVLPHAEQFRSLSTADFRDVHTLPDDRLRIFWVLAVAKDEAALGRLSAPEISDILRECTGINIRWQKIVAILSREKEAVSVTTVDGRTFYRIMKKGVDEVSGSSPTIFVDPGNAFSAVRGVEEIIDSLGGDIRFCDTYIDRRTLDFLMSKNLKSVKLLTVNIQGSAAFSADLKAFEKQFPGKLIVRQLAQGELHDRYIVHEKGILVLGSSLKDVGKKQSFIISLGKDISQSVAAAFDRHWNSAKQIS